MQKYLTVLLILASLCLQAQTYKVRTMQGSNNNVNGQVNNNREQDPLKGTKSTSQDSIAPIFDYKIISIQNDTIAVDTAMSIQKHYRFNPLRKDEFGLLAFANEGQPYNVLNYGYKRNNILPGIGFTAKHFNYLEADEINYYLAPTPYTDLMYKTVVKQGQVLDAFIAINTSKNLNFFIGYRGMRSLGRYINQLSSSGNFRMGSSYQSENKRYLLRTHFTFQDLTNQENGGITNTFDFEQSNPPFDNRDRLDVYFRDVETQLEGKRFYVNHQYQLNSSKENGILLTHQLTYEDKFFNYMQPNASVQTPDGLLRFGNYFKSEIDNKTRYFQVFNRLGAAYQSSLMGRFEFFTDWLTYNYSYKSVAYIREAFIPNQINKNIHMIGGKYTYHKANWKAAVLLSNSLGKDATSNVEADLRYRFTPEIQVDFGYQKLNKMPDLNYQLYQSDYVSYNWFNDFKNEKINEFRVAATTPWLSASAKYSVIGDKIYFSNDATALNSNGLSSQLLVTPKQYNGTVNYLSLQLQKEFKWGKFALDNTFLYQNTEQAQNIVNVPSFVTRNTLYYTDAFFKKALQIQTGVTLNYFSSYYANDYNPLIGDFYVQDQRKIGDFPTLDFFVNMKVRTARIYLKLEHFNSSMTGYKFYAAPNYPTRDFIFRFGLVWNFFS